MKGKSWPVEVYQVLGKKGYRATETEQEFNKGIQLYQRKDFSKAILHFKKASDTHFPSQVFLTRCHYLLKNPPEPDWNGIWVFAKDHDLKIGS